MTLYHPDDGKQLNFCISYKSDIKTNKVIDQRLISYNINNNSVLSVYVWTTEENIEPRKKGTSWSKEARFYQYFTCIHILPIRKQFLVLK